jgi:hypothetical protein
MDLQVPHVASESDLFKHGKKTLSLTDSLTWTQTPAPALQATSTAIVNKKNTSFGALTLGSACLPAAGASGHHPVPGGRADAIV